jgi:hypothetical protein
VKLRHSKLVGTVAGTVLLVILVWYAFRGRTEFKGLIWLKPGELAHYLQPGPFTRLKFRILRLPGPLWRWYMSGREQIVVETRLLTLSAEAAQRAKLPSNCQTNVDGARAWLLSAEELTSLKQQLKGLPGVSVAHVLSLTTYDGGQAQLSAGAPPAAKTNSNFIGLTIDLLPKVVGHSFNLLLGATSTDSDFLPDGTSVGTITNLTAACKVLLPNGGALVVDGGTPGDLHQTNHWAIISIVAVDARGRPKRF